MDFLGFVFEPEAVLALVVSAWGAGLLLGGVAAILSSLAARR